MNHDEGQKYTAREAASHLSVVADHLKDYVDGDSTIGFCLECLGKHFSSLRMLGSEGQDFFPEDRLFWYKLRAWCDGWMDHLMENDATPAVVERIMAEARTFRKTLQSKYFGRLGTCGASGKKACSYVIGSVGGECVCLTGFEPCCKGE